VLPYAIHKQTDGSAEYEYIERISLGTEIIEENHYFLRAKKGKMVGKRMNQATPPSLCYDLIYDEDPSDRDQY